MLGGLERVEEGVEEAEAREAVLEAGLVEERDEAGEGLSPTTGAICISLSPRYSVVSRPIRTIDRSNDSHGPWLSRTLSIVLARHRLTHSHTRTELRIATVVGRWRRPARTPRCRRPTRRSPDSRPRSSRRAPRRPAWRGRVRRRTPRAGTALIGPRLRPTHSIDLHFLLWNYGTFQVSDSDDRWFQRTRAQVTWLFRRLSIVPSPRHQSHPLSNTKRRILDRYRG